MRPRWAAASLATVRGAGIVHRDLEPENILSVTGVVLVQKTATEPTANAPVAKVDAPAADAASPRPARRRRSRSRARW